MVGLVGYTKHHSSSLKTRPELEDMIRSIKTNPQQNVNYFTHEFTDVAMVTLPTSNFHSYTYNEDGSMFSIIYGKIYNYNNEVQILKNKGHKFRDVSNDAEFILHSYEQNGDVIFRELNGSFVIVISNGSKLMLITDRFCTRPLYYALKDDELIFSSYARAILEYPFPKYFSERTLVKYLLYGGLGILGDDTWFKNIKYLPSSSILTYRNDECKIKKYWELLFVAQPMYEKDIIGKLANKFEISVNTRVSTAEGRGCVFLSGGLDSRLVLSFLNKTNLRRIFAITFGTKHCDEISIAKMVTKKLNVKHKVIEYEPCDCVKYVKDTIYLTDGLNIVSVSFIPYVCEKLMNEGVYWSTQGLALDMTLGGSFLDKKLFYIKNYNEFVFELEKKFTIYESNELKDLLNERLHKYISIAKKEFNELAEQAKGDNFPNKADYFTINTRVQRFTLMGSVITREYIEELFPTIDNDLIEIIRKIPPELRYNHNIYRKFLNNINIELAKIPYQKTSIPPIYPLPLWFLSTRLSRIWRKTIKKLSRGKIKYVHTYFNYNEIIRVSREWKKLVEETIINESSLIYKLQLLKRSQVKQIVDKHMKEIENNGEKIIYLISIELFLQRYFKN